MLESTNPLSVEDVFGGLRILANTGFISQPRSFNHDTIPFDSDAPNAAANSSASALRLATICCLRVYAFKATNKSYVTEKILIVFMATIMSCNLLIKSKKKNMMYKTYLSHLYA